MNGVQYSRVGLQLQRRNGLALLEMANKKSFSATRFFFRLFFNGERFLYLRLSNPGSSKPLQLIHSFDTREGCFDCAWAENNENLLLSCCGDGTLKIWDLKSRTNPLRNFAEHRKEVYSVAWNPTEKCHFLR